MTWLKRIFCVILVYVAAASYYNVTRLGKVDFPEMIPHIEYIYAFQRYMRVIASQLFGCPFISSSPIGYNRV